MNSLPDTVLVGIYLVFISMISFFVTGLVRKYSLHVSLLDEPNERSSHSVPTPRGGGLSISISVIGSIIVLMNVGWIPDKLAIAMLGIDSWLAG